MTHEELLAEINEYIETCEPYCSSHIVENMPWVALRAVVELCKSNDDTYKMISSLEILEAIEKELSNV